MFTKEEAYSNISLLVERFHEQIASYKKSEYNEMLARQDYINPFFKALGWDVDNSYGNAEANREVIHEDKLKLAAQPNFPPWEYFINIVLGEKYLNY